MTAKKFDNIRTALLLFPLIILVKMVGQFPWWSFVIPVVGIGMLITLWKWKVSCFATGFLTGFTIWCGANLMFHHYYDGIFLNKFGLSISILFFIVSGLIGGSLTGLALFTGRFIVMDRKAVQRL